MIHNTSHSVENNSQHSLQVRPATGSKLPVIEDLPQRVREYAALRGLGYSFREIGHAYNVTPQAVAIMLARHRERTDLTGVVESASSLSSRAANVLGRLGLRTPEQARAVDLGKLLANQRNCGQKTVDEIRRWATEPGRAAHAA